jgi:LacI family transcriptional regulator
MATIKDVAALAGVSYTTVSHVINNSRPVSDHARSEVADAIRKLSYVPSAIARSLKHRATATIGLLISNNTNPFFSELARGIEDACYQNGYSVILCNSDDDPKREQTYLRVLLERRIDGLIISSTGEDRNLAKQLSNIGIPFVVVDRPIPGLKANLVQIDHLNGGYLATKHLLVDDADPLESGIEIIAKPPGKQLQSITLLSVLASKNILYRCLDLLLDRKAALFSHLKSRWQDLFGIKL